MKWPEQKTRWSLVTRTLKRSAMVRPRPHLLAFGAGLRPRVRRGSPTPRSARVSDPAALTTVGLPASVGTGDLRSGIGGVGGPRRTRAERRGELSRGTREWAAARL